MKNVKFAIVGLGNIGQRHKKFLDENDNAKVVELVDIDPLKISMFSNGEFSKRGNYKDIILDNVDVVNICTPHYSHYEISKYFLERGVDVLVEKPMTMKWVEAKELVKLSKKNKCIYFPVLQNRFNKPVKFIKDLINDGALKDIYSMSVTMNWNRTDHYYEKDEWRGKVAKDWGTLGSQCAHFVDLISYLSKSELKVLFATGARRHTSIEQNFDDEGIVIWESMDSKTRAIIQYSTNCYDKNIEGSISILAKNGSIKIGGKYLNKIEYCHIEGVNVKPEAFTEQTPANNYGSFQGTAANHQKVFNNLIDYKNGLSNLYYNADEASETIKMIEDAYKIMNIQNMI